MRPLVIKLTAGSDEPEKCAQAFTVAATALAVGSTVSLWLTGEATWLAVPGRAEQFELANSPLLSDLRDAVLDAGRLTVCTQCASRRNLDQADLLPRVRIAGAATYVEEVLADQAQALVY
jgi:predicted peroxiredoxin